MTMRHVSQLDDEEISDLKEVDRGRKVRHVDAAVSEGNERVEIEGAVAPVACKSGHAWRPTFVPGKTSCYTLSAQLRVKKKQIEEALRRTSLGQIEFRRPLTYEEFELLTDALSCDNPQQDVPASPE